MKSKSSTFSLSGNIVDLIKEVIFKGTVYVKNGKIDKIIKDENITEEQTILPGLIDSHIHVESSMLIPSEFARLAVVHGTVCTVSDPHEIANVLGVDGVNFMIENGKKVPFKFYFGAPACVPATPFETSGAKFTEKELDNLLKREEIHYLSEMMNFPGVINHDPSEMKKIEIAEKYNKPIDGHAPGVKGEDARKYAEAGVSTDHECFTMEEALEKIRYGMKIQIREGSAAKNFEALVDLLKEHPDKVLFCSDDRHPDSLAEGHINDLVKRAIAKGYDSMTVLKSAIINPIEHYNLDVGILQPGDAADMIIVDNLIDFNIKATYIDGIKVAEKGKTLINQVPEKTPNNFNASPISINDLFIPYKGEKIKVIEAYDGELITGILHLEPKIEKYNMVSDVERDILKMTVLNRYEKAKPSIAFIKNFGLEEGAFASTVAHDSHNIIAIGTSDKLIAEAVNTLVNSKGGICIVTDDNKTELLSLPVAGLMSEENGYHVAEKYKNMNSQLKKMGVTLQAPFMTLSFMALLVIPDLKLSDKGLFDGRTFSFTTIYS